jgi:pyrroloquinoline quinone (PQQ) biosynthesis protein C
MHIESRWLKEIYHEVIVPRRRRIQTHPFVLEMQAGVAERVQAEAFFSGLYWHLLDFGKHVSHLLAKRPLSVAELIQNRSEDKDGDTEILGRIVKAFGGPLQTLDARPWSYRPHSVWIRHDALLRSAIYSQDLPWQVGTAALNVGIESLVPSMIEPLFQAAIERYHVQRDQAAWLESRSGEEEKQHGENGFIILDKMVPIDDIKMIDQCRFFIEALSSSMAFGLLESGMRDSNK